MVETFWHQPITFSHSRRAEMTSMVSSQRLSICCIKTPVKYFRCTNNSKNCEPISTPEWCDAPIKELLFSILQLCSNTRYQILTSRVSLLSIFLSELVMVYSVAHLNSPVIFSFAVFLNGKNMFKKRKTTLWKENYEAKHLQRKYAWSFFFSFSLLQRIRYGLSFNIIRFFFNKQNT